MVCSEVSERALRTLQSRTCAHQVRRCDLQLAEFNVLKIFFYQFSDESPPENFDTFLETVNKNLRPLFMEIRHGISEEDGSKNYGLVRN